MEILSTRLQVGALLIWLPYTVHVAAREEENRALPPTEW